jgi:Flp pilus assembly protein TadG
MTTASVGVFLRSLARSESGNALVELAVCLPLLVLTLIGTADFARVFYTSIELTNAARAGAQYGSRNPGQSSSPSLMQTTATGAVNITGVTATAARLCQCASDAGAFSDTTPVNSCTTAVTTACTGGLHRVMTVTVTTQKTFTTIVNYIGIPASMALTRAATLRVSE